MLLEFWESRSTRVWNSECSFTVCCCRMDRRSGIHSDHWRCTGVCFLSRLLKRYIDIVL